MALTRGTVIALCVVLMLVIGGAIWSLSSRGAPARGAALTILPTITPKDREPIAKVVSAAYTEYRANAIRWSAVYFGCVFGSAFFSALAGLVLKLDLLSSRPNLRSDMAAIFAMIGALLVTLSTAGDFQRKWQANRDAAAAMENLSFDVIKNKEPFDQDAIIASIQTINAARSAGITQPNKPERKDGGDTPKQDTGKLKQAATVNTGKP